MDKDITLEDLRRSVMPSIRGGKEWLAPRPFPGAALAPSPEIWLRFKKTSRDNMLYTASQVPGIHCLMLGIFGIPFLNGEALHTVQQCYRHAALCSKSLSAALDHIPPFLREPSH